MTAFAVFNKWTRQRFVMLAFEGGLALVVDADMDLSTEEIENLTLIPNGGDWPLDWLDVDRRRTVAEIQADTHS